jgi:hypothetical protein
MLAALIVGALTAWYLGLKLGIIVAGVAFVALLVANFVPGMTLTVYALVIVWAGALYFFGPKISKASGKTSMSSVFGSPFAQAQMWAKTLFNRAKNAANDRTKK